MFYIMTTGMFTFVVKTKINIINFVEVIIPFSFMVK